MTYTKEQLKTMDKANPDDWVERFWKHNYVVTFSPIGPTVAVNADHEQDALDYAADWAETEAPGVFLEAGDIEQDDDGNDVDVVRCGNHCLPVSADGLWIEEVAS